MGRTYLDIELYFSMPFIHFSFKKTEMKKFQKIEKEK